MKSAIGQENVTASALQMAMVAGTVANGGVEMTPHVMEQIRDSQGNLVETYTAQAVDAADLRPDRSHPDHLHAGGGEVGTAAGWLPGQLECGRQDRHGPGRIVRAQPAVHRPTG